MILVFFLSPKIPERRIFFKTAKFFKKLIKIAKNYIVFCIFFFPFSLFYVIFIIGSGNATF